MEKAHPIIAAMIELQLLTGMRSGELVIMRVCDLEMSGQIWFYRPPTHKTSHRGHDRIIAIGHRCQEILKPWLCFDLKAFLFTPQKARGSHRKSGKRYTVASYRRSPARR